MSRYDALTRALELREEADVVLTFEELDSIVGGLPASAKQYHAWWANNANSQPHARTWLDAGRRAQPDFRARRATFSRLSQEAEGALEPLASGAGQAALAEYVESSISLERDLETHLAENLERVEPGLELIGRQVSIDVGRVDLLAKDRTGGVVVVELKVGDARESAVGQVAKYIGWYSRAEKKPVRAYLIAASFSEPARYAAAAVSGLELRTYRVTFDFDDAGLQG